MHHRSYYLVLIAFFAMSLSASACINETGTKQRGETVDPMNLFGPQLRYHLLTRASLADLISRTEEVVETARMDPSFRAADHRSP